jgi:hypothetical protein
VWFGHPDTTGIDAIDYFLTTDSEALPQAALGYSERLYPMRGLGTAVVDTYSDQALGLAAAFSPRQALLLRAKLIEQVQGTIYLYVYLSVFLSVSACLFVCLFVCLYT